MSTLSPTLIKNRVVERVFVRLYNLKNNKCIMQGTTMRNTHKRFPLSAVTLAMLTATSLSAKAEEVENADEEMEVIEVKGLASSLKKSINDKRFSQSIQDSINAEDIGKSTDQNIAEALSRVTGVSVQSVDGEGTTVTVRGANSQQNNISLNGVTLGATDFSQSVDLSSYSSDILSKIEVVKTPSADHEEGSLGANINLTTTRPLELSEPVAAITLQGRYNDLSENEDYKVSGSFSKNFLDNSLGFFLTAYDETNSGRKDQYRADTFQSRFTPIAKDTQGNVINDVTGIAPYNSQYELIEFQRDRQGIDFGLQWQPSNSTDVYFSANWSNQRVEESMHGVKTRGSDYPNLIQGVDPGLFMGPAPYTDPAEDWFVYDENSRMFTKFTNRFGLGDLIQSERMYDNENRVASFTVNHQWTDSLNMDIGVGYSKAKRVPDNDVYVALQNYNSINAWLLWHTPPEDMEPVGYDCTSGRCELVAGQGLIDWGANDEWGNPDALWDNRSTTGFNPDDLKAQHLAFLNRSVVDVDDTTKSAHVDFDYAVDFGGFTMFEFGAKWTKREKFVDNQQTAFNSVAEGQIIINPDTGEPVTSIPGITEIRGNQFQSDYEFPDDFMGSLGYGRDHVTDGWNAFSAIEAFNVALGNPNIAIVPDNTETRDATLDNIAAYFKANFEYFDSRLTGNVGVRYVKTTVDTNGYSGVNFHFDPGNLGRVFDPFKLQELRDTSLPLCNDIAFYGTDYNEESRWSRVDGKGYDTGGTVDKRDDVMIPDQGPCHDPRALQGNPDYSEWWLWRHSDVSTEAHYVYGDRKFDENGQLMPTEDRSKRAFGVSGKHEYDVWLPSLNLNYALNDEMILRFATSKTMARPQIDSLRPGFKVTETVWGGDDRNNVITLTSPQLDPLESVNFDLSYEWYFNESSLFAAGIFYKDMTNFEESETVITYMDDLRGLGLDPNAPAYNTDDLLLIAGQDDLGSCMPKRIQGGADLVEDWVFSDDPEQMCAQFKTTRIKNGKGARIGGAELQYTQTFDMLPSFWSGLGITTNYTYQDSQYDQEVSSIDSSVFLPELPVAYTPEHTYNLTAFWEKNGHQLRLSYRGNSDQLVQRSWEQGTLWEEGRQTLDFSATYQVTDWMSLSFHAINLTDEGVRQYYTSRFLQLGDVDGAGNPIPFEEGNALDGGADTSRTVSQYKTGRSFRLSARVAF